MALDGAIRGVLELKLGGTTASSEGFASSSGISVQQPRPICSCRVSERRKEFLVSGLRCREDADGRRARRNFLGLCGEGNGVGAGAGSGGGDGGFFKVRAEVAGGSAGPNTGIGASGSATKGRDGDDTGKAQALSDSAIYPVMRVYRNDLCSLEITGDAKAWEVVSAMAADGGFTASEELSKGRALMTVETIVPGRLEDHSTVSTKLLAPTELVNKRAKLMWAKGVAHKKVSLSSGNALARAFQSVVVQRVLAFDLRIQRPGTVRDMANLANEKETGVVVSLESRDRKVLEGLAEAVCSYAIANIKDTSQRRFSGKGRFRRLVPFWNRPEQFWASEKAICVSPMSDNEVWEYIEEHGMLGKPELLEDWRRTYGRAHQSWWTLSDASSASNFLTEQSNIEFFNEFVPIHKIEIDISKVRVDGGGWQKTKDNILELRLTHAQLVDVADMLDLFYEDGFTAPAKKLRSGMALNVPIYSRSKVANAIWTGVAATLAGGLVIVALFVASRLRSSSSASSREYDQPYPTIASQAEALRTKWCTPKYNRKVLLPSNTDIPREELAALCSQLIVRMKDGFNLDGEVKSSPEKACAWLGPDITEWGRTSRSELVAETPGNNRSVISRDVNVNENSKVERAGQPLEEVVLCYQVVLQRDGKILGFQPCNKPAISYWANYPFAEDLHKGRRLGPGLIEPGLRYVEPPKQMIAIELLCRPHSETPSIAARPIPVSEILGDQQKNGNV